MAGGDKADQSVVERSSVTGRRTTPSQRARFRRIVDAAMESASEGGYDAVQMRSVADRAGVSHQTVSRYLRNNGGLKPATVARVRAAIDELNYRPNRIARSMRTRRTGRIAILLPTAARLLPLRLLGAASAAAHEAGYTVDLVGLEGGASDRGPAYAVT